MVPRTEQLSVPEGKLSSLAPSPRFQNIFIFFYLKKSFQQNIFIDYLGMSHNAPQSYLFLFPPGSTLPSLSPPPNKKNKQKWDPVSKHKAKGKQNVLLKYFVTGRRSRPAHIARGIVVFAKERKVGRKSRRQQSILPLINSFSNVTVTGYALLICKIRSHLESTSREISGAVYM